MNYLIVILSLFIVIFLHELGHLIAGLYTGAAITSFNIGFGKKLFTFYIKGVEINLRLFLVLGGYVQFKETEDCKDYETSLVDLPFWKKIIVNLAGVTVNFIFALISTFALLVSLGMDVGKSFTTTFYIFSSAIVLSLTNLNRISEFSSPIGIVAQGGDMLKTLPEQGMPGLFASVMFMSIMLHIGVGVTNLLPLSALDGGRCIVDAITALTKTESIARRFLYAYEIVSLFGLGLLFVFLISKDSLALVRTLLSI